MKKKKRTEMKNVKDVHQLIGVIQKKKITNDLERRMERKVSIISNMHLLFDNFEFLLK